MNGRKRKNAVPLVGRKIALRPSNLQRLALAKTAGCARFTWNWALGRKQEERAAGRDTPSAIDLHRELNVLKKVPVETDETGKRTGGGFPWMYETSKAAPQEALHDLDDAFKHFFHRVKAGEKPGYPRFKAKRTGEGHFRLTGAIRVKAGVIQLPRIGDVRIQPGCRGYAADGDYVSVSVVQEHGEWFASVKVVAVEAAQVDVETAPRVGLDWGVRKLATMSDGTVIQNPRALRKAARRLKHRQRALSRKIGPLRAKPKQAARAASGRWKRARKAVANTHRRVTNVRQDAMHKATAFIAATYSVVVIEDLKVRNMTRRARGTGRAAKAGLNRSNLDAAPGEFRRQLTYKLKRTGCHLLIVPAPYTSQTCSACQARTNCGSNPIFTCAACGFTIDRDLNAARNILAASYREALPPVGRCVKRVEASVSPPDLRISRQSPVKREREVSRAVL